MVQNGRCEAEFATLGKESLFKAEPRRFAIPEDRMWRPERVMELVAKPFKPKRWEAPPIVYPRNGALTYGFDIRPDCVYWLSLAGQG